MRGKRKIYGGRSEIRKVLYMAALVASRHNKILKLFYQGLIENEKPKKLTLTAVMRKLLIHLNLLMNKHLNSTIIPASQKIPFYLFKTIADPFPPRFWEKIFFAHMKFRMQGFHYTKTPRFSKTVADNLFYRK